MIYSKQLKLTFWAGGEAPRGSRPPPPSRMILTPTLRFPSHWVRRNKSIISCQISAFTSFDPLKLVFSPVFLQILKDLGLLYKIHVHKIFHSTFVREHNRAKNVAWMLMWCRLDADCVFFAQNIQTIKWLDLYRIHIHIQSRYTIHSWIRGIACIHKIWYVWGSSLKQLCITH